MARAKGGVSASGRPPSLMHRRGPRRRLAAQKKRRKEDAARQARRLGPQTAPLRPNRPGPPLNKGLIVQTVKEDDVARLLMAASRAAAVVRLKLPVVVTALRTVGTQVARKLVAGQKEGGGPPPATPLALPLAVVAKQRLAPHKAVRMAPEEFRRSRRQHLWPRAPLGARNVVVDQPQTTCLEKRVAERLHAVPPPP